jgi:ABC-type sugar transport system ATPase subunit
MAAVSLQDLTVSVGRQDVLDGVNVEVADGEFAAVIGPSGTGKSTLLRSIAGLVTPSRGRVVFDGIDITSTRTAERDIGLVFQSPVMLPSRNVRRNVEFPLEIRRQTAAAIKERVGAEARAMHIEHLLERNPAKLSRGEQQLVQIARTMVRMPKVLLLDEPFAPLDEQLRERMRREIRTLQAGYGVTTLMATSDPADAMSLASLLIVLDGSPASVVQVGTPIEVHDEPASLDIAAATGPMWQLSVRVAADGGGYWLSAPGLAQLRSWAPALGAYVGSVLTLGARTGGLVRHERGQAEAQLVRIVPGAVGSLLCRWGEQLVMAVGDATPGDVGTTIRLSVDRPQLFDPVTGSRVA